MLGNGGEPRLLGLSGRDPELRLERRKPRTSRVAHRVEPRSMSAGGTGRLGNRRRRLAMARLLGNQGRCDRLVSHGVPRGGGECHR